jgi:diketogulonate reductase-like aldo/keto reductase
MFTFFFPLTSSERMPWFSLGLLEDPQWILPPVVIDAFKAGYRCLDSANDYDKKRNLGMVSFRLSQKVLSRVRISKLYQNWSTYQRKSIYKRNAWRHWRGWAFNTWTLPHSFPYSDQVCSIWELVTRLIELHWQAWDENRKWALWR